MELSIKLHTIKSGWSIIYIEGSQVKFPKIKFLSLRNNFVLANSADPDEMPPFALLSSLFAMVSYGSKLFGPWTVNLKELFEKVNFKKSQQTTIKA